MDFIEFLYRLRDSSKTYQQHVENDIKWKQFFGALARLNDDDIHELSEIKFLKDLWGFLEHYHRSFYQKLGNDDPDTEVIIHFMDHILNLNIRLCYFIEEDFHQFTTQYGGEERARLRIETMMKSYFADPYAIVNLTTGSVIIETHLEPFVMNVRKIEKHPLIKNYSGNLIIKDVKTKPMLLQSLTRRDYEAFTHNIEKYIEIDKMRDFKTCLHSLGIKDDIAFDSISEESIHYHGHLNAYVEYLFFYLDDSVKNDADTLSEVLSLDNWLSEDMKQAVKESEYITPFEWLEEKIRNYFHIESGIIPKLDPKNYGEIEWKHISKENVYIDIDLPVGGVKIKTSNVNWKSLGTIIEDKFKSDKMDKFQLWFHVTTIQYAELIIQNGIELMNKPGHKNDFGLGPSFYVSDNLMKAFNFVRKKEGKSNYKMYAIVFSTPTLDELENLKKSNDNNNWIVWNVNNEEIQVWTDLVKYTMQKEKRKLNALRPNIKNTDFIYGRMSKRTKGTITPRNDFYQLAIKSEDGADYFTTRLVGVIQINY